MSYISNFLALPFYPLGFAVLCIAAGIVAHRSGQGEKPVLRLVILSGAVLYGFSTGPLSYRLVRGLEDRYPPLLQSSPRRASSS